MNFGKVNSHLVVDCDEVLVRISPKWVYKMHLPENYPVFEEHLQVSKKFDLEKHYDLIMMRDTFQLYDWLKRDYIEGEFSQSEILEIKDRCLSMYDDPEFYDDLQPTPLGRALSTFAVNKSVKKISIITRNLYESSGKSKMKFLQRLFHSSMDKVTIYELEAGDKKSDIIKEFDDVSHIFEDEVSNIIDIVDNCTNLSNAIISVPKYGYNVEIPMDTLKKADERDIEILRYDDEEVPAGY